MRKYVKNIEKWMKISKLVMFIIAPVIGIYSIWTTLNDIPTLSIKLIEQSGIQREEVEKLKKDREYYIKPANDEQNKAMILYKTSIEKSKGFKRSIIILTVILMYVMLIEYYELKNSNELETPTFYLFLIEYGENKGKVYKLAKGNLLTLGANLNSSIHFMESPFVSGNHGKFLYKGDELRYEDHSSNGTMILREDNSTDHVNKGFAIIKHNDVLYIGNKDTKMRVIFVS